ncbi:MAG: hypothetical protein SF123_22265 [Chloroflexota bacterium]|nr:hypothetical protein [Chloroflexota bacterium]
MKTLTRLLLIAMIALALAVSTSSVNAANQYRRWIDVGTTYTCSTASGGIVLVNLFNLTVEFSGLPANAQYTNTFIQNGIVTTQGPFPVEQTDGTRLYGNYGTSFRSYPANFEFRIDTLIDGIVVYQSSIVISCTNSFFLPRPVTIVNGELGVAPVACVSPLDTTTAVQGRLLETITALYEPRADATTNVVLPAGSAWWITGSSNGYYRLWIACLANPVYVPASAMAPNHDTGGAALP